MKNETFISSAASNAVEDGDIRMMNTVITIIKINLIGFPIIGCFGNVNIIIATIKNKTLHNKCSWLLCQLAVWHIFCLLWELLSGIRLITNTAAMTRRDCFNSIAFYLFSECMGKWLILSVAFDRLLSILFPFRDDRWNQRLYLTLMTVPGVVYGCIMIVSNWISMDEAMVIVCNPPAAYTRNISDIWTKVVMILCAICVATYMVIYYLFWKMGPSLQGKDAAGFTVQRKIVMTLSINLIFLFVSSILCFGLIFVVNNFMTLRPLVVEAIEAFAVIPGLAAYSCYYFVLFWRSTEYRNAFLPQLRCDFDYANRKREGTIMNNASSVRTIRLRNSQGVI